MANTNGIILWSMGGAGVLLIYAAVKNKTPQSLLLNRLGVSSDSQSIQTDVNGTPIDPNIPPIIQNNQPLLPGPTQIPRNDLLPGPTQIPRASYTVSPDITGTQTVYDYNGNILQLAPDTYQNSPQTFIPVMSV